LFLTFLTEIFAARVAKPRGDFKILQLWKASKNYSEVCHAPLSRINPRKIAACRKTLLDICTLYTVYKNESNSLLIQLTVLTQRASQFLTPDLDAHGEHYGFFKEPYRAFPGTGHRAALFNLPLGA
jgi:hypothetical protein